MALLAFSINALLIIFFARILNLVGRRYISAPGMYILLSALPTITLILPAFNVLFYDRAGYYDYLVAIILHTLCTCVGVFVAYFIFNASKVPRRLFDFSLVSSNSNDRFSLFILLVVVCLLVHQIFSLGSVPIMQIFLSEDVASLTNARESSYKLNEGIFVYFWHFSRMIFAPFLVVYFFSRYYLSKTHKNLLVFILVLVLCIINNSLSGAVAPVAMLFLCSGVMFYYLGGQVSLFKIFIGLIAIFSFPFYVEYTYSSMSFIDSLVYFCQKVLFRFSGETFDRTLSYFDIFPYESFYLGGRTNGLFTMFSGLDYFNVQNMVFLERLEEIKPHLINGSANAHYIGYMNADFGMLGVILGSFFVGLLIGVIDLICSRRIQTKVQLSIYIVMSFIFWKLMGSQPTTVLFSHGALLCMLMIVFYPIFNKAHKKNECN
jgi:oligosaccharide repeat unit polymerase